MVEYINQRTCGTNPRRSSQGKARCCALPPIMMTTVGSLPGLNCLMSHDIGSDSQSLIKRGRRLERPGPSDSQAPPAYFC